MNNWTVIINLSIGVAGLFVSILGLIMSIISRPIEKTARLYLSGLFFIMTAYSATTLLSDRAVGTVRSLLKTMEKTSPLPLNRTRGSASATQHSA